MQKNTENKNKNRSSFKTLVNDQFSLVMLVIVVIPDPSRAQIQILRLQFALTDPSFYVKM